MEKRNLISFTVITIFILLLTLSIASAVTGSIGNSKMILRPTVDGWTYTTIERSILVKNVNDVPVEIELKLDENAQDFIDLIDTTFSLEPGQNKKAKFEIKVRSAKKYDGKIQIFFTPKEGDGPGVVLSSHIIVIGEKEDGYIEGEEDNPLETDKDTPSGVHVGTGKVIDDSSSFKFNPFYFSTFVLALLFVGLLILINKRGKESEKKNTKKKGKKKK